MRNSVGEAVFGSPTAPAGAGCKAGPDSRGSQKALTPGQVPPAPYSSSAAAFGCRTPVTYRDAIFLKREDDLHETGKLANALGG